MRKRKLIDKKATKHVARKCYFCPVDNYASLHCHRIVPGEEGGKYTDANTVVVCANHHTQIHDGQIVIDRKYPSTAGRTVLHYWENGEEKWL
jgi:hypothetical protein